MKLASVAQMGFFGGRGDLWRLDPCKASASRMLDRGYFGGWDPRTLVSVVNFSMLGKFPKDRIVGPLRNDHSWHFNQPLTNWDGPPISPRNIRKFFGFGGMILLMVQKSQTTTLDV